MESTDCIDGILEVFNLLNHDNFGSYETEPTNANFGNPQVNTNIAYLPRIIQLGIRLSF